MPDPAVRDQDCICDRDTLADNLATPGCPVHAPFVDSKSRAPADRLAAMLDHDLRRERWERRNV